LLSVVDVAPTVLHLLGLPIPGGVAGRVLLEGLVPAARYRRAQNDEPDIVVATASPTPGLDAAGEAEIVSRLRSLGYLE
jgi:hypothetical protein